LKVGVGLNDFLSKVSLFSTVLLGTIAAAACSNIISNNLQQGNSQGSANTPQSDGSEEVPTVLVAGVNLTGSCTLWSAPGEAMETQSLECAFLSDGQEQEMVMASPRVMDVQSNLVYPAKAERGKKSTSNPKAVVVGSNSPMTFQFDIPRGRIDDLLSRPLKLMFESIEISGRKKEIDVTFEISAKRFVEPAECAQQTRSQRTIRYEIRGGKLPSPSFIVPVDSSGDSPGFLAARNLEFELIPSSLAGLDSKEIRVCNVAQRDVLTLGWPELNLGDQRLVVSFGTHLLFTDVGKNFAATESLTGFKASVIPSFKEFNATLNNKSPGSFGRLEEAWCAFGTRDCLNVSKSGSAFTKSFPFKDNFLTEILASVIEREVHLKTGERSTLNVWIYEELPVSVSLTPLEAYPLTTVTPFLLDVSYVEIDKAKKKK
jgi:hypothetical protein